MDALEPDGFRVRIDRLDNPPGFTGGPVAALPDGFLVVVDDQVLVVVGPEFYCLCLSEKLHS